LSAVALRLPSLRERPQELAGLIDHFVQKHALRHRKAPPRLDDEGLRRARAYAWPGNTHELEAWVESAVVLGRFEPVGAPPLAPIPLTASMRKIDSKIDSKVRPLREAVAQAERAAVGLAMREARGQTDAAARLLGISAKELFNQLSAHGLLEERWE
jgi:DNA-binding NtrC family response regulator